MKREGGKFWRLYSQQSPGVVSHRVSKEVDGWCRLSNEHLPAKASSVALDPSLGYSAGPKDAAPCGFCYKTVIIVQFFVLCLSNITERVAL